MGRALVASCSEAVLSFFPGRQYGSSEEDLTVVTAHVPVSDAFQEVPDAVLWKGIHLAWEMIQSSCPRPKIHAWRMIYDYGQEIVPGLGIFRLRDCDIPRYFCLLPDEELFQATDRLLGLLFSLSAWRHLTMGRDLLHAAGVVRGDSAYLFVGPSGAGKSTVSSLSASRGYRIIHDDCVVVYPAQDEKHLVTDCFFSHVNASLKCIFFLSQDITHRLMPLSATATAKKLLESSFDGDRRTIFFGKALENAFAASASIARSVPAYELHFRKSPDFWDVIDAELGL